MAGVPVADRSLANESTAGDLGVPAREAIEAFLLRGSATDSALHHLADAGLGSHVLRGLAQGNETPGHLALRRARLTANARHAAIRAVVVPLFSAWRDAGIETLVFKGFYLAEAMYDEPADRLYSDVDVSLRPASRRAGEAAWRDVAEEAARVASHHGWTVLWRLGEPGGPGTYHRDDYVGHELLQLRHESGVNLDAHRRLVHNNVNVWRGSRKADRLTEAVWQAAGTVEVGGVEVFAPSPADSALVGLVVARSWSGDAHAIRPHDYLDLSVIVRKGQLDERQLWARAEELGLRRTLRGFLGRCDPSRRVLDLAPPGPTRTLAIDIAMMPERFPRWVATRMHSLAGFPLRATALLRALRIVGVRLARPGASEAVPTGPDDGRELEKGSWTALQVATRRALLVHGVAAEAHPLFTLSCLRDLANASGYDVRLLADDSGARLVWRGETLPLRGLAGPPGSVWPARQTSPGPAWPRLRRLTLRDLALRIEAFRRLRVVREDLARRTFSQVQNEIANRPAGTRAPVAAAEVGRAVESAARYVPGALCVAQALVAQAMLRDRGAASSLHMGFLRDASGDVTGHAWLEVDGTPVTGDVGLDRFTRTARFEA